MIQGKILEPCGFYRRPIYWSTRPENFSWDWDMQREVPMIKLRDINSFLMLDMIEEVEKNKWKLKEDAKEWLIALSVAQELEF